MLFVIAGLLIVVPWFQRRKDPLNRTLHSPTREPIRLPMVDDGRPEPVVTDIDDVGRELVGNDLDTSGGSND